MFVTAFQQYDTMYYPHQEYVVKFPWNIYFRKEDSVSVYNKPIRTLSGQKLKVLGYQTILDNFALPTLWQQLGEDPSLFQHDNAPVQRLASTQDWFEDKGVEQLDSCAEKLDLNSNEYLWVELEHRL